MDLASIVDVMSMTLPKTVDLCRWVANRFNQDGFEVYALDHQGISILL